MRGHWSSLSPVLCPWASHFIRLSSGFLSLSRQGKSLPPRTTERITSQVLKVFGTTLGTLKALKKLEKQFLFLSGDGAFKNWPEASLLLNVNTVLYLFTVYNIHRGPLGKASSCFESTLKMKRCPTLQRLGW